MKNVCFFVGINLFSIVTLFSQPYALAFEKNYGGSLYDWPAGFVVLEDSSIVTAAYSSSNDFDVNSSPESGDFWIYKLDKLGNIIWEYSYGGESPDSPKDILQTSDGGFLIAGDTFSDSGDISINYGSSDMWIIKINSGGILEWELSIGGTYSEAIVDMQINMNDEIIFTGSSNSDDGLIGEHFGTIDDYDIIFGKISPDGELLFLKVIGTPYYESSYALIQNSSGNYIIAGHQFKGGLMQEGYLTEITEAGEQLWEQTYGGSDHDQIYSIAEIGANEYYFSGFTYSNDGDISGNHSTIWQDMWVGKINGTGALLWSKCYGGSRAEVGQKILPTGETGFVVVGNTSTPNDGDVTNYHISAITGDIWVVEMDTAGVIKWSNYYGGFHAEVGVGISLLGNGFAILGVCRSTDGDVANHYGDTDYPDVWLFKLDKACDQLQVFPDVDEDNYGDSDQYSYNCLIEPGYVLTGGDCDDTNANIYPGAEEVLNRLDDNCDGVIDDGVDVEDISTFIQVYPTLATTYITIHTGFLHIGQIEIYNMMGEKMAILHPENLPVTIPINEYDPGVYLIKVFDINSKIFTTRFVKLY